MKRLASFLLILLGCVGAQSQTLVQKSVIVPPQFSSLFDSTHTLSVDERFDVSLYYIGALVRPRFMTLGPDGKLFVADMDADRVFRIDDLNNDGVGDTAVAVTPHLDSAHSLAFYGAAMFVAEPSRIRMFEDLDHDGFFESETPFITGIGSAGVYNHYTRTLYVDSTAGYLYVTVGASCNACREVDSERATVLRFKLDGSGREVFASGLRNALGITKGFGDEIWVANADRDGLGDETPYEMVTHIHEHGFYGWPLAYGHREWDDFSAGDNYFGMLPITAADSARIAAMDTSDVYLPAHSTPMQLLWDDRFTDAPIDGPAFYLAVHGSSAGGRAVARGYKMIKIERSADGTMWNTKDFVTGFLSDSLTYKYWARPCGLVLDGTTNTFYLSSDAATAAIFKISPTDAFAVKPVDSGDAHIVVYPNPASSSFSLKLPSSWAEPTVSLVDVLGRRVGIAVQGSGTYTVRANEPIAPGMYSCHVRDGSHVGVVSVVIR